MLLPTFSPPIVMVKPVPDTMLAPDVVMRILLLESVAAKAVESRGTLQDSMVGVIPFAKKPEPGSYEMVIVPPAGSVVMGVNETVILTPTLFKRRSRGSMPTEAADTNVAETCGSTRSDRVTAAATKYKNVRILDSFLLTGTG